VLRPDWAVLVKKLVAAGLLAVEMGVDEITDGLARQRRDGGLDLVVERRKLAVHHDDAVVPHCEHDVAAAAAYEHVGHVAEISVLIWTRERSAGWAFAASAVSGMTAASAAGAK
jgi:hypothetical protein